MTKETKGQESANLRKVAKLLRDVAQSIDDGSIRGDEHEYDDMQAAFYQHAYDADVDLKVIGVTATAAWQAVILQRMHDGQANGTGRPAP